MGMKDERAAHAKAAQDRMYDAMDEKLGWKEPTKKQKEEQKKKEEKKLTPELCQECRFRANMCWLGKMRNQGINFRCEGRQLDPSIKKEKENETLE